MKLLTILLGLLCTLGKVMAQQNMPRFDAGNNDTYSPFTGFVSPVADSTPTGAPVTGLISNLEKDLATKVVKGAASGIHLPPGTSGVRTVRYDLYVTDTMVHYTGNKRHAIAVNGSLPAPTLVFTVGDTAVVYVHNLADEPTAVHWHGVMLPNRMDGVPFLTQEPIPPHTTYLYKFPVLQTGTYWYHSHFSLQEQIGLYGALIFNKRTEPDIPTIPVVLSDWTDVKPKEVDRMLHTGNDWFSIEKGAVQSYSEAFKAGATGIKFANEWKRMKAMDVSDVYYERFLTNGRTQETFTDFRRGDRVRLRLVNGAASSYFWLTYGGGRMTVVANDGNDVVPVTVDRLIVGPSETYDLIVSLPENMKYEFRATAEDRTGFSSLWLGQGAKVPAPDLPALAYFKGMDMMNSMMQMDGNMQTMGMQMSLQQMDMNAVMYPELADLSHAKEKNHGNGKPASPSLHDMHPAVLEPVFSCPMHPEVTSNEPGKCPKCGMTLIKQLPSADDTANAPVTLNYNMLESPEKTVLPAGPWKELTFELTGNMNRYVWSMNNRTVSESDKILIKRGENVRIILYNNSMMRHPMHLHGHDFRLLNRYGAHSPLKNVVDILPMETDTLEFHASEEGDWFFHCHILYHMMSGMGRIFSYENSSHNPEIPHSAHAYKMLKMDDRMFHLSFQNDFATNGNDGHLIYANTRWAFQGEWRIGYRAEHGYEVETHFGRYLGKMQWLFPYVGIDWRYRRQSTHAKSLLDQQNTKDDRSVVHFGVEYMLPWLTILDASVDHHGYVRMQLMRDDIPLTPRLRGSFMVNTDREYSAGARYIFTKLFSLAGHYDSDMGWGAGITLTY